MLGQFIDIPFVPIMATPSAPAVAVTGDDNNVTYTYKAVGIDSEDGHSIASSGGSTTDGATALSVSNYNTVTWTDPPGATYVDIYRTVGGVTQGKIARVLAGVETLDDTGLVGDAATAPATDTSGIGVAQDVGNLRNVGIQFAGTFVGTVQLEGTLDGTNYFSVGSAATGAATVIPSSMLKKIRAKSTAYTSGTPVMTLGGQAG